MSLEMCSFGFCRKTLYSKGFVQIQPDLPPVNPDHQVLTPRSVPLGFALISLSGGAGVDPPSGSMHTARPPMALPGMSWGPSENSFLFGLVPPKLAFLPRSLHS